MSHSGRLQDVRVTDRGRPSRLVLLRELKALEPGTKNFQIGSDIATFSCKSESARKPSVAIVNLEAVLGTVPSAALDIGSWMNIVGYIAENADAPSVERPANRNETKTRNKAPYVQALMGWSAGDIDVVEYENVVRSLRVADRGIE
ncbi:hypothetical protein ANO11243_090520 [Dothideomycetidae sp. 11243]|nr:hypothetical protein ANO11243_090520 [fungal sp. No.11243]